MRTGWYSIPTGTAQLPALPPFCPVAGPEHARFGRIQMFRSADDADDPLRQSHRLSGKPSWGLLTGETSSTDQIPAVGELVVGLLGCLVVGPWHEEASVQLQQPPANFSCESWPKSQSYRWHLRSSPIIYFSCGKSETLGADFHFSASVLWVNTSGACLPQQPSPNNPPAKAQWTLHVNYVSSNRIG
ncbi:hypothetical protein PAAG_07389 [Paracoccidioides lutzii Pb01]|uniref:Uncharacterized protein n=1 Tax=Paracoccidioides lutzii (strain ATCC MYA-826 / Pb01) TaxID=502779 RepID=C1H9E8_PARBA|nr:hypothetical protein PAAG_07389 [Paracoccidioides lutzii Pb01]EEH36971.2 hypothetical protein PAAG_07389 [Paracoccidioides lutzii Pb01]